MDWSGCDLVEVIPGKHSSGPFIRGTRISADDIVSNYEAGSPLKELVVRYPSVAAETLRGVLAYAIDRLAWNDKTLVDWSGCKLVEQVPGRCSGAPTVVGSRIFPDTIAKYFWSGAPVDEIQEDYPSLSSETISGLIAYVKTQEALAA